MAQIGSVGYRVEDFGQKNHACEVSELGYHRKRKEADAVVLVVVYPPGHGQGDQQD